MYKSAVEKTYGFFQGRKPHIVHITKGKVTVQSADLEGSAQLEREHVEMKIKGGQGACKNQEFYSIDLGDLDLVIQRVEDEMAAISEPINDVEDQEQ